MDRWRGRRSDPGRPLAGGPELAVAVRRRRRVQGGGVGAYGGSRCLGRQRTDVAVSGTINATDIGLVKSRSGFSVP